MTENKLDRKDLIRGFISHSLAEDYESFCIGQNLVEIVQVLDEFD